MCKPDRHERNNHARHNHNRYRRTSAHCRARNVPGARMADRGILRGQPMRPDHRYDPAGAAEIWQARFDTAVQQYQTRQISDDVFRASLKSLGFYGERARLEYAYQDETRHRSESKARRS